MSAEEPTLLQSEPLEKSATEAEILLFGEDVSLGPSPGDGTQPVLEGTVRLGKHHAISIPVEPGHGVDPKTWALYLVRVPFTLDPPPGKRSYEQLTFRITIGDERVTAYDLFPPSLVEERKTTLKFGVTPSLKFQWMDIGGDASYQQEFDTLIPVITVFDVGRSSFRWEYEASGSRPVLPGNRWALMILEVPKGVNEIDATVTARARVRRTWMDDLTGIVTPAAGTEETVHWSLR